MSTSIVQLLWRLRTANRVVLAMVVAGLALLAYNGAMGFRYWDDHSRGGVLQEEMVGLLARARHSGGVTASLQLQVDQRAALLQQRGERFVYAHDDELIRLVSSIARASGVTLTSVSAAGGGVLADAPLSYTIRTLSVQVTGSTAEIYGFVDSLSDAAPALTISSARLGALSDAPSAALELNFLLDPRFTHERESGS